MKTYITQTGVGEMYYRLFKSKVESDDGAVFNTYGIKYVGGEIADITFDKERLEQKIILFNRLKLEPEHIMDAVYDLMCEPMANA